MPENSNHISQILNTAKSRHSLVKAAAGVAILLIIAVYSISIYVGWQLTHPIRRMIDVSPTAFGLSYRDIVFTSRNGGLKLRGWLIEAPQNRQTIIFAHGYGRNRLQNDVPLLPIASMLVKSGMNVITFDFRNSGESEGSLTSVGENEVDDLLGAVDFVKSHPELNQKVILYGFSMGASTAIAAGAREEAVAAVIADSPFADLQSYLLDNLSVWSKLPKVPFNHTILSIIPSLTGLRPETVSPVKEIANLGIRPLLIIHGEEDKDIPISNSLLLQAAYSKTRLVSILGADHVGSFAAAREKYLAEVTVFLNMVEERH